MALDFAATYKILVLGDSNVGKTCIVHRFCDERYYDTYISTIGIDFKQKIVNLDGMPVKLQIWDTAGQERFRTLTTAYYRGAMGILLLYDVTNLESFNHITYWLQNIEENASPHVITVLAGNKCESNDRIVDSDSGRKMAEHFDLGHFEVSCKDNINIENAFMSLARKIRDKWEQKGYASLQEPIRDENADLLKVNVDYSELPWTLPSVHKYFQPFATPEITMKNNYEGYEKIKTVGQGAFGTATLYKRLSDHEPVVIKEIFTMDMDESEKQSAQNEVHILSNLNHPNIIKYIDSFEKGESLVIIMEYADGGNLSQLINAKRHKNDRFKEKSVLNIVSQISSAIAYMHSNKILHRDLKTANIFLTMTGCAKVGDFGISKMLNTRSQAQTVVGTPYYLSPEICEGSDYNEKSDIWAIGCILYELTSLRKPFEAATLPVLVQKITSCEYETIPLTYSDSLWDLVKVILQKNPTLRPSAQVIHDALIPRISGRAQITANTNQTRQRSILYKMTNIGDETETIITPMDLPHKSIINFDVGPTHCIAITSDHNVYGWGENNYGQLGFTACNNTKKKPTRITDNTNIMTKVIKCALGLSFTILMTETGTLYSCGDGRMGCLGHGDWNSTPRPKGLTSITSAKIVDIATGHDHVVALSAEGRLYTWGSSKQGQLGQGHTQCRCKPLGIKIAGKVTRVFASRNCTVVLLSCGRVLVCGDNSRCQLGIVDKREIVTTFTAVEGLFNKETIKGFCVGESGTMWLTDSGDCVVIGGGGVYGLARKVVVGPHKCQEICCYGNYNMAGDDHNVLWFWGGEDTKCDGVKNPQALLVFYASKTTVNSGTMIYMRGLKATDDNLYILAETTAPPPIKPFSYSQKLYLSHSTTSSEISASSHWPSTLTDVSST